MLPHDGRRTDGSAKHVRGRPRHATSRGGLVLEVHSRPHRPLVPYHDGVISAFENYSCASFVEKIPLRSFSCCIINGF